MDCRKPLVCPTRSGHVQFWLRLAFHDVQKQWVGPMRASCRMCHPSALILTREDAQRPLVPRRQAFAALSAEEFIDQDGGCAVHPQA